MQQYSHIIFDLDGTLIDSAQGIYSALSIACRNVDGTSFSLNNYWSTDKKHVTRGR